MFLKVSRRKLFFEYMKSYIFKSDMLRYFSKTLNVYFKRAPFKEKHHNSTTNVLIGQICHALIPSICYF